VWRSFCEEETVEQLQLFLFFLSDTNMDTVVGMRPLKSEPPQWSLKLITVITLL